VGGLIERYTHWLHTRWPAGTVEKLPVSGEDGVTSLPGVRIVGDLTGIPLLKFSSDTGARAVRAILRESDFLRSEGVDPELLDVAIIGGGVAGISAAIEAKKAGLNFAVFEATQVFSTVANFPRAKPIYTYPTDMQLDGGLQFKADVKEALLDEMEAQRTTAGIAVVGARIERLERKGGEIFLHDADKTVTRARRAIIAIGRSGNFRRIGCPGEDLDKVYNRLFDPKEFAGKDVLVVGGGDSALETAIALTACGANTTLSYRKMEFSRPKPENVEKVQRLVANGAAHVQIERPTSERVTTAVTDGMRGEKQPGSLKLALGTELTRIDADRVFLKNGADSLLPNDIVFTMLGREAPLEFFRRSGIPIRGEWRPARYVAFGLFFLFCIFLYLWKAQIYVPQWVDPAPVWQKIAAAGTAFANPRNLLGVLAISMAGPAFYYTLAYCACVVIFGARRIRRRKTPYVKVQTITLMIVQCLPLFLLPEIILPWMGNNGWFGDRVKVEPLAAAEVQQWSRTLEEPPKGASAEESSRLLAGGTAPPETTAWTGTTWKKNWPGIVAQDASGQHSIALDLGNSRKYVRDDTKTGHWIADGLFPPCNYGHGREYWRAYGFILAFPLNVYNVFTDKPLWLWLAICFLQTFVIIPALIYRWGKGAYCGWLCSCGALAETLGDDHRHKMPHGPGWNRFNMAGQAILAFAFVILAFRIAGWLLPGSFFEGAFESLFNKIPLLNYHFFVDLFLAGMIGVGFYFWFSGRVWCRFFCPLAALMHIYTRFSRFRIFPEKSKCISCNVCTSVCHQGIDIMNFANKGVPMSDPECVRCSACVQQCPTGVLAFGHYENGTRIVLDKIPASPVRMREQGDGATSA
jgi:thioredoxin reductase/polyferredoxin